MIRVLPARRRRFAALQQQITHPRTRPLTVLDVGGEWSYWQSVPWQQWQPVDITLLNTFPQQVPPPFTAIVGDARRLPCLDQSFDLVFSNSCIGHVGEWSDQQQMARELVRVGRRVYLQTPNHYFPIDWRTCVPGFHWLPRHTQAWCLRHTRVGVYPRVPDYDASIAWARLVRNLTHREVALLFPNAHIQRERVCGFTKSFTVMAH